MRFSEKKSEPSLCNEFQKSNFGFHYKPLEQFYRSQWQNCECSWHYLIYRWISAIFFIGVFLASLIKQYSNGKYFTFYTNWGIIFCLLTQLTALILVIHWHFNLRKIRTENYRIAILTKFYWLMHGISVHLAMAITIIYWTFLYKKMNKPLKYPVLSFITHSLNSVFMLIDFIIADVPVRLLHSFYAMIIPVIYFVFSIIYYTTGAHDEYGNRYIYPILDWTLPVHCLITFIGVFFLYVAIAILLFALYKLKNIIQRSITHTSPTSGNTDLI